MSNPMSKPIPNSLSRTALIVGATGLVGSACLRTLLSLDNYSEINVLVRKEFNLDLSEKEAKKLKIHLVDFDALEAAAIVFSVDDVFCCLGTTLKQAGSVQAFKKVDYDYCLKTAELAAQKNVQHFLIVTAINAKESSLAYYSRTKGELQNQLKKLSFNQLSIFQPSLLLGERKEFRLSESLFGKLAGGFNAILPKSMSAYKAIEGEVVGKAMANLAANNNLKKSESELNFYYYDDMKALADS
jgi:uncharacterized protein YbjT (DUF2867 family)